MEAALQGLVLLEVFLVLIQCGGTDGTQLATRQGRLKDVCSVHSAFALAGPDERVYLIDKEDDTPIGLDHLVDDALQSLLELALVLSAGYQRTHVEREQLFLAQVLRHVATQDSMSQSLDNSGFTGARLADEDRIVLRAARKDLQHATYLVVTPYDRVELACARFLYQVARVFREALVSLLARLRLHLLSTAQLTDGSCQFFLRDACILQYLGGSAVAAHESEQQYLQAYELIALLARKFLRTHEYIICFTREIGFATLNARQALQLSLKCLTNSLFVDSQLTQ